MVKDPYALGSRKRYLKAKPTEPWTYRQFFTLFLKRNGLGKVKFHEIRHTFTVRALEIPEYDIKSLSKILGHKKRFFYAECLRKCKSPTEGEVYELAE